jgi:pterin-4a-carbinolamine dehydratase
MPARIPRDLYPGASRFIWDASIFDAPDTPTSLSADGHDGWQETPDGLVKRIEFPNRRACAVFTAALMAYANRVNHHPDVEMGDNGVTVTWITHATNDVTAKDRAGAAFTDSLVPGAMQVLSGTAEAAKKAWDRRGRGRATDPGGIDPANKETWYRNGGDWNRSVDGEQPYGWASTPDDYEPPPVTHKMLRMKGAGLWGGSHFGSSVMAGHAAKVMGIGGYRDLDATNESQAVANRMLEEISADAAGSEEPLYHSFENVSQTVFRPGDTLRLPLTATSGKPEIGYATRLERSSQSGVPTVFVFPKGTSMVGYSTPTTRDLPDLNVPTLKAAHKEAGHIWDEAVVAGGYKVASVETKYFGSQHHDRPQPAGTPINQIYGHVVHLIPTEVFNTQTKKWVKRG